MISPEYLISDLLPSKELSLFSGPSGGNKTTQIFQMIEEWRNGRDFFGHTSHPVPFVYVSVDRSHDSVTRTLNRIGVKAANIPIYCAVEKGIRVFTSVMMEAKKANPEAIFFIIDGFASLVPQGKVNDYDVVAKFLSDVTRFCKMNGCTVLGVVHSSKTKEGESYLNPRERILGSVAWAGYSETIFYIAPINPEETKGTQRVFEILPRNAPAERYELELDGDGRLIKSQRRVQTDNELESFLSHVGDIEFSVEELMAALHIKKSAAYRMLDKLQENSAVMKVGRGAFKRQISTFFN